MHRAPANRPSPNNGRVREDSAPGCPERFDFVFLKWAWTWQRAHAAKYRLALAEYAPHANLHIFAERREADRVLASLGR